MPVRTVATVVLVHGAGSGPAIFAGWYGRFGGAEVVTPDLHAHLDVAAALMDDYARTVAEVVRSSDRPVALCGWSMGGLVAAMAARDTGPDAMILIEPSPPAEIQANIPDAPVENGTFDPEEVYGAFPEGIAARPESQPARGQRKRGISIPSLPDNTLLIYGDEFRAERGRVLARFYGCEEEYLEGASHWDLVLDPEVPTLVGRFLERTLPARS